VQASVPGCPYATIVQYIRDAAIRTCERTLYWRYQPPLFDLSPGVHEYAYNKPENTDVHAVFAVLVNDRPLERLTMETAICKYPEWADLFSGIDPAKAWCPTPPTGLFNAPMYDGAQYNDSNCPIRAGNEVLSDVAPPTPPTATFNMPMYDETQFNSDNNNSSTTEEAYSVSNVLSCCEEQSNNDNCRPVLCGTAFAKASTPQAITQISPDKYIILPLPDNKRVYKCRMFLALKPKHNATGMDSVVFDELEEVIMHGALQHLLVLPDQPWSDRELAAYHARQYVFQIAERRARANLGNVRGLMRVRMQPFGA